MPGQGRGPGGTEGWAGRETRPQLGMNGESALVPQAWPQLMFPTGTMTTVATWCTLPDQTGSGPSLVWLPPLPCRPYHTGR